MIGRAAMLVAMLVAMLAANAAIAQAPLRIWSIDAEGGAATLFVTPEGHSLLIDAGWPAGLGGPSPAPEVPSPPRAPGTAAAILAAAKAAGITRIDYLLITHYHVDHVGGVPGLAAAIPIGTYLDHGPNREAPAPGGAAPERVATAPATLYPAYLALAEKATHRIVAAGESIGIDGLTLTAVNADRKVISTPLPAAGQAGVDCASFAPKQADGGEENAHSLGVVLSYGKARILAIGDTTWNVEHQLVCPRNRIGKIDLMMSTHHGSAFSNSPSFVRSVRPTVILVNNGETKGGDAEVLDTYHAVVGTDPVWQLHSAVRSPGKDGAADHIANLAGKLDAARPLLASVTADGAVTLINPRNGVSKTYPKAR